MAYFDIAVTFDATVAVRTAYYEPRHPYIHLRSHDSRLATLAITMQIATSDGPYPAQCSNRTG
jgi:hypothetical protein